MGQLITIGLDIAKSVFQVHGVDAVGEVGVRRQIRRGQLLQFFAKQPACLVGIEACASAHYWARELRALGHDVRLMPASYVKPYVKRQKNDAADAEAICEAVTRPTMRFVDVKSPEQQSVMVLHKVRLMLMRQRIQLSNAIRGTHGGIWIGGSDRPRGASGAHQADRRGGRPAGSGGGADLPRAAVVAQLQLVNEQILKTDRRIRASARSTDVGRRLMEIPGVGPLLASALVASVADPKAFKTGRNLAAWVGLVPKQNSSGGKERLGGITKQGDRYLRQLLVIGALAVGALCRAKRHAQALARAASSSAGDEGRDRRPGQQDRPHGVEDHDQRRTVQRTGRPAGIAIKRRRADKLGEGSRRLTHPAGRYRRTGEPICASAPRARAFGRDPSSRKALWPAVTCTAPTGRTHGRTDQPGA